MAESYEKWGSWGSWHNPRYDKPKQTVTYISTRTLWRFYHDRRPSEVVRHEKRYKTERLKQPVGTPQRPTPPRPETPVKTEPTPEYIEPSDSVSLDPLKGKPVMVTFRDPTGRVKSFYTQDTERALSKTSGELVSIFEHTPEGGLGHRYYYDKTIMSSPTIMEKELVSYIKSGREVPSWYKEQVTIPPEIKTLNLDKSYLRAGFESQMFSRSPLFKYSGLRFEKKYKRTYTKAHKPTQTGIDVLDWQKAEGSLVGGGLSFIFMPWSERIEYTKQSLFGDPFGYKPGTREIQWRWDSPFESKQMQTIRAGSEYQYVKAWERGDWGTVGLRAVSSPFVTMAMMYGLGLGMGALKQTAFGSKALLVSRGKWAAGAKAGQPLYTVTPSKLLEGGIVGYGVFETGKSFQRDPAGTVTQLAVTLPFIFGAYRSGAYKGASYMQKTGALSKVKGLDRTRQVGLYETIDISSKLKQPRLKTGAFDLTQIQRISPSSALRVSKYLRAEQSRWLFSSKPRFGGSTSTQMQLGGYFRTDTLPGGLRSWAVQRQTFAGPSRPLIGKTGPLDIDLLVYSRFGGLKRAGPLRQPHVIDVHTYKIGEYYWGGKTQLPSRTGMIYDPFGKTMKVKLLSPSEQFLRKSVSILPSESMRTGYRTYKDVPDWFDIGDVMSFQKGGTKLRVAMDKVIHPEKYPVPKVTFGEKLIGKLGVKPFTDIAPTGKLSYNIPAYPTYAAFGIGIVYPRYIAKKYKPLPSGRYKAKDIQKIKTPSYGGFPTIKKTTLYPVISKTDFSPSYPQKIYKKYKTPKYSPYPIPKPSLPETITKKTGLYVSKKFRSYPPRKVKVDIFKELDRKKLKLKRDSFDVKYQFRVFKFPGMKLPDIFKEKI